MPRAGALLLGVFALLLGGARASPTVPDDAAFIGWKGEIDRKDAGTQEQAPQGGERPAGDAPSRDPSEPWIEIVSWSPR